MGPARAAGADARRRRPRALDRFGQRASESSVRTPRALLTLSAPENLRGGLFFQSRLDIRAVQDIGHPRIVLDDEDARAFDAGLPGNSSARPRHQLLSIRRAA